MYRYILMTINWMWLPLSVDYFPIWAHTWWKDCRSETTASLPNKEGYEKTCPTDVIWKAVKGQSNRYTAITKPHYQQVFTVYDDLPETNNELFTTDNMWPGSTDQPLFVDSLSVYQCFLFIWRLSEATKSQHARWSGDRWQLTIVHWISIGLHQSCVLFSLERGSLSIFQLCAWKKAHPGKTIRQQTKTSSSLCLFHLFL